MAPILQTSNYAQSYFPELDLGDERRNRRFSTVIETFMSSAGDSLPAIFPDSKSYTACLRLFHSDEATHENILGCHQAAVLDAIEKIHTPVLLIHDATVMDFSGHTTLKDDVGQVGNKGGRGWLTHQTVAVDPQTHLLHGLVSQIIYTREKPPKGEKLAAYRQRKNRESLLWSRALDEIGPVPKSCQWIDMMDRGADIFELFRALLDRKRQFIIRSTFNRGLGDGSPQKKAELKLHDELRRLPATAGWNLEVPGKTGQKPRTVRLSGASQQCTIRVPHVKLGIYPHESLTFNVVRVWEESPSKDGPGLEWILLTNLPVETPEQIEQIARWYACRMNIEEYHKTQKSGALIEGCQVQDAKAMKALIATLSVVSVMMINLRMAARDPAIADRPATDAVPELWVRILDQLCPAPATKKRTIRDFLVRLARVGGYKHNPKSNPPGWITIWKGWTKLQFIIRYELSRP
jgi:hypothetical protein